MDVVSNASERGAGTEKDQGRRVRVDELPIGQAIAQPIRDANGTVLIRAGQVWTERLCRLLKQRGILWVEG
jgi:beta-lactamase superfamily II metal-dependent hydrolase